jgi:transposase
MSYPDAAWERAMKVQDVLLKGISGEWSWCRAAEVLGWTPRTLRRWRGRYEAYGYAGLLDKRLFRPSGRAVPPGDVERVLRLYRERYAGFNVRHFVEIVRREHAVKQSYSWVKQVLQAAGLVRKQRARGRHRRRREPRACVGELLHLDGSPHAWLALAPEERSTLVAVPDDATNRVLYAQLWAAESTVAVMSALTEVFRTHGLPMALYSDRAHWAFHTPRAKGPVDRTHLMQVGRASAHLGVEHIPAYSPQARGRSERLNRTFQDRLVNERRVAGITTLAAANAYLRDIFVPHHNATFSHAPRDPEPAWVPIGDCDLDQVLCHEEARVVSPDNTVRLDRMLLQVAKQPVRRTCAGLAVVVRRHLDGRHSIWRGPQRLGHFDAAGRPVDVDAPVHARTSRARTSREGRPRQAAAGPQRPQASL